MSDILGIAASAAGGGLFGVLGTALGRVASFFETRQKHTQEQAAWSHELKLHELNMQAKAAETEQEIALAAAAGSWSGLSASIEAEAAIGDSYPWVNAVRALTRPVLTVLLWAIAALVFLAADAAGRAAIVETVVFAATAATLWWFGDRAPRR